MTPPPGGYTLDASHQGSITIEDGGSSKIGRRRSARGRSDSRGRSTLTLRSTRGASPSAKPRANQVYSLRFTVYSSPCSQPLHFSKRRFPDRSSTDAARSATSTRSARLGQCLLLVATVASAFDYVLVGIPDGQVLAQLSAFWFGGCDLGVAIATDVEQYPAALQPCAATLRGRSMLPPPPAAIGIARGYLSGSGWKEYQHTGSVCGVKLPSGLLNRIAC